MSLSRRLCTGCQIKRIAVERIAVDCIAVVSIFHYRRHQCRGKHIAVKDVALASIFRCRRRRYIAERLTVEDVTIASNVSLIEGVVVTTNALLTAELQC